MQTTGPVYTRKFFMYHKHQDQIFRNDVSSNTVLFTGLIVFIYVDVML